MKIVVFITLLLSSINVLANLGISLNKTKVVSGEPFILEIEATNSLAQTVQGGITVSFSSNVDVIIKNPESKIYPVGSSVKHNNFTNNMMVENWYTYWPSYTTKTMRLELSTLETGVLELYIRAAFLDKFGTVINIPINSNMYDQQNYPVLIKRIQVKKSNFETHSLQPTIEYEPRYKTSLEEKIGQMLIVGFRGLSVNNRSPIIRDIKKYNLGGVILFDYDTISRSYGRNIKSSKQVRRLANKLQSAAKIPLFIAIDQEGGKIRRLKEKHGFPNTLSAQYLGNKNNLTLTYNNAAIIAENLKNLGINFNFAPVVDLNINQYNPAIGKLERSFSANPVIVTNHARTFIEAHRYYGIINAIKHFPGHGSSTNDSHYGITDVTNTWQNIELNPYANLINEGMVDVIMTAHILNRRLGSKFPATLSKTIINDLLRTKLGYNGVVISDDMQMDAIDNQYIFETSITKAIKAGVDIILIGNNLEYDEDVVARTIHIIKHSINKTRINQSYNRVKHLKEKWLY